MRHRIRQRLERVMHSRPPDMVIGDDYLHRWYLIPRNRWCNVYLHRYMGSDDDRALHDHPWPSLSWMLYGALIEHDQRGSHPITGGDWRFRRPAYAHRLELVSHEAVTLFMTGPRVREWGFWTAKCGWLPWRKALEYDGARMRKDAEDC